MPDLNEWISPKDISDSDDQEYQSEESDPGADNSNTDIESDDEEDKNKFLFKWIPSTRHSYTTPVFRVARFPWEVQFLHYKNYLKIRVICNQNGKYNGWTCRAEINLKLVSPKPERARSIAQKKTACFDPSDNVLSFYFCEWKDLLKYFLHGKTVKLEVEIWSQESVNAAEVENEFLYNELEYLIKKVEGLIAEDANRENEIAKEKALSDQLRKENEDLKTKLKKLSKERDEAYKYKAIFEEDCRKLVHDEVVKIQKSNTPESSRSSERHRRPIRNIQFLMD